MIRRFFVKGLLVHQLLTDAQNSSANTLQYVCIVCNIKDDIYLKKCAVTLSCENINDSA